MAEPIIAGRRANPSMLGPNSPNRSWLVQAPTKAMAIDQMIPPGKFSLINASPMKPMMMAIMMLTSNPNKLISINSLLPVFGVSSLLP